MFDVVVKIETMENGSQNVLKHLQVFCQCDEILLFHQYSMNTSLQKFQVDS